MVIFGTSLNMQNNIPHLLDLFYSSIKNENDQSIGWCFLLSQSFSQTYGFHSCFFRPIVHDLLLNGMLLHALHESDVGFKVCAFFFEVSSFQIFSSYWYHFLCTAAYHFMLFLLMFTCS